MKATTLSTTSKDSTTSVLEFELAETFTILPGLDVIPEISTYNSYEDDTDIGADERSELKHDLPEEPELELVLKDMPGNTNQKAFTDLVEAYTAIPIKITRSTGRVQSFDFIPQNYKSGESAKSSKQLFACVGKIRNLVNSLVA